MLTKFEKCIEQVTEFIVGKKIFNVWDDVQDWRPKWAKASEFGAQKPKPKRKYKRKKK